MPAVGLFSDLSKLFSEKEREYGTPSMTQRGEMVRSHAEKKIADYFANNGIHYLYEWGAQTDALIFKRIFAHPDFYLPDYNVYVEYWGLLGASKDYERNMKFKMSQYHRYKIRFISLYPDNLGNLDWIFRAKFRRVTGVDLPPRPQPRHGGASGARFCANCGSPIGSPGKFCTSCGSPISEIPAGNPSRAAPQ